MASNSGPARYSGPANLTGKVAVVTGGSQGLGEAIARLFAERGAAGLVICGRNEANGARVAAEIQATGCPTFFVRADLESVADCRNVIAEADRRFKRVDVLVNAAGLTDRGDIFSGAALTMILVAATLALLVGLERLPLGAVGRRA